MAAPAAPLVVEGGAVAAVTGALILALLLWATLFGLQKFYTYTLGAVIRGIAHLLDKIVPFYDLGSSTIGKLDDGVQYSIGLALTAAERSVARTWQGLTWIVRETGDTLEFFAHATVEALHAITHGEIPAQVRAQAQPATQAIADLRRSTSATLSTLRAQIATAVHGVELELDRLFGQARAGIDALQRNAIPRLAQELAGVRARVGALGGYVHGALDRRIGRLEGRIAGSAIAAGALAAIYARVPWIRCSNVGKLGRAACRTDTGLLDALLAGSLLIIGTISLEQMARELREPTDLVMSGVEGFVRELRGIR
jgi:hypothetical protein